MSVSYFLCDFPASSSARARSTASARSLPASFSALVSKSIARCWSFLWRSTVPCTKKRLDTDFLPSSLLMSLQGNGAGHYYASYLTYSCYALYHGPVKRPPARRVTGRAA